MSTIVSDKIISCDTCNTQVLQNLLQFISISQYNEILHVTSKTVIQNVKRVCRQSQNIKTNKRKKMQKKRKME